MSSVVIVVAIVGEIAFIVVLAMSLTFMVLLLLDTY